MSNIFEFILDNLFEGGGDPRKSHTAPFRNFIVYTMNSDAPSATKPDITNELKTALKEAVKTEQFEFAAKLRDAVGTAYTIEKQIASAIKNSDWENAEKFQNELTALKDVLLDDPAKKTKQRSELEQRLQRAIKNRDFTAAKEIQKEIDSI